LHLEAIMKPRLKWFALLAVVTVLFFWKIVLSGQFSMILEYEGANQGYSWYHFSAASLQKGVLPLWDPYTHSGRSFSGEMQTGLFYPLKLPLYFWPLKEGKPLSERGFHILYVFAHLLAAGFMFLLAEELGLERFPAFVSAICFGLGGFVGKTMWPDMVDSAIWLPLIFLFLLRALNAGLTAKGAAHAALAGAAMGMSVLGGRLHVPLMEGLVVVSAAAFFACAPCFEPSRPAKRDERATRSLIPFGGTALSQPLLWAAVAVAIVAVIAFAVSAVQLLPSMEYSKMASRALGGDLTMPARQKIPYAHLNDGFLPNAIFAFFLAYPFGGNIGHGEVSPYLGVLPSLLAGIGIWRGWKQPWVRYLAGLAVLSFFYSLGLFTLLHGLLYALVPYLWMGREPGRFIYLTHFALALLAGFGVRAVLSEQAPEFLPRLLKPLRWVVGLVAAGLAVQAMLNYPPVNEWSYFALTFFLAALIFVACAAHGRRGREMQAIAVLLILFDFGPTHWIIHNKAEESRKGTNHLALLLNCRGMADFLKAQPGLFRVDITGSGEPNIGDLYGVQTTGGMSATQLDYYGRFFVLARRAFDLLNVRYLVRKQPLPDDKLVFQDGTWSIYENASCYPRAWVVHQAEVEPSAEALLQRVGSASFDPRQAALLARPLETQLEPAAAGQADTAEVTDYGANRIQVRVRARSRGLLVLSEVDYPGWRATVNGAPAAIHRVDGLLRGVAVPPGESIIVFRYVPRSVLAGALLSCVSLLAIAGFAVVVFRKPAVGRGP
jgi:hypothetical protein